MTTVDQPRPFGVAPQRTPVQFDPTTGGLRIGEHERRIDDPSVPTQVYSAYLSLLHAVRGTKPGTKLPLRTADLEALLLIVGDDPETIEENLVGLMGLTAEEATVLGGLLLRHRRSMATLGVVATLAAGVGTTMVGPDPATPRGATAITLTDAWEPVAPVGVPAPAAAPAAPVAAPAPVMGPVAAAPAPVERAPRTSRATALTSAPSVTSVPLAGVSTGASAAAAPTPAAEVPAAPAPAAPPAEPAQPAQPVMPVLDGEPVWDAPPPEPAAPSSDIGEAASLFPETTPVQGTPAQGVSDPSATGGDSAPAAAPVPAAPLPSLPTPVQGISDPSATGGDTTAVEAPPADAPAPGGVTTLGSRDAEQPTG
jgi:hypothetical protein